jgi:hypothetical protein
MKFSLNLSGQEGIYDKGEKTAITFFFFKNFNTFLFLDFEKLKKKTLYIFALQWVPIINY